MNAKDIQQIHLAGLISDDQRDAIIKHFSLHRAHNKLLLILSIIGGIMVAAGLILVMAANWQHIPDGLKLAAGPLLMAGCHLGGWYLRSIGRQAAVADGLNLVGSLLFLGNIALIGQVFNLSSRPQNAFLLWVVGIAPTAFLLRSKAQHVLTLLAATGWLAFEFFGDGGWFHSLSDSQLYLAMLACAFAFAALGVWLKPDWFGPVTEKHGILLIHLMSFPLTLPFLYGEIDWQSDELWLLLAATGVALGTLLAGVMRNLTMLPRQWRMTWAVALAAMVATGWLGLALDGGHETHYGMHGLNGAAWVSSVVFFIFCMIQTHVGLLRQSPWFVNVGIVFIAVHLITAYIKLFGSMFTTGAVFIVGGVFLIAMAIYLEKKRRRMVGQIAAAAPQTSH